VKKLNTPFYLTGGTALSRHYFHHRFSDDLDLFLNDDKSYNHHVENIFNFLEKNQPIDKYIIDYQRTRKEENYAQLFLIKKSPQKNIEIELKIDLVNDISAHYGDIESDEILGSVDSWRNILSNKLSAIFRYEAKDFVDIWIIAREKQFFWKEIIAEAKTKECAVDPIAVFEILKSFPANVLSSIKWNTQVDEKTFVSDLGTIADDIFYGRENNLSKIKTAN